MQIAVHGKVKVDFQVCEQYTTVKVNCSFTQNFSRPCAKVKLLAWRIYGFVYVHSLKYSVRSISLTTKLYWRWRKSDLSFYSSIYYLSIYLSIYASMYLSRNLCFAISARLMQTGSKLWKSPKQSIVLIHEI